MMYHLHRAREAARSSEGVTVPALTPRERRILITREIGNCHRRLMKTSVWKRAFIATATWMPVWHLMKDDGPQNVPEDAQVKLQHLKEYDYAELFKKEIVLAEMEKINEEKAAAKAEQERVALERKAVMEAQIARAKPYVEKAKGLMAAVHAVVSSVIESHLELVHRETGLEEFLIGGSWASAMIVDAISDICQDGDHDVDSFVLEANDIDVYHGSFTSVAGTSMSVHLDQIDYTKIDGLEWEVNTVRCDRLSAENFLANNDINVTASCFHVDFTKDELFSIHASPCFWEFVFQKNTDRRITTVYSLDADKYEATTCVRIAYKAFQLGFKHSFGDIDLTRGTLAKSQKEKFDKMKDWTANPFDEYQCKKCHNHFVLKKKSGKIRCKACIKSWANTQCTYQMCKKCCVSYTSGEKVDACKIKSHKH